MIDDSYSETCSCEEEKPAKLSDPPCCAKCPFCRRQIKLECFESTLKGAARLAFLLWSFG